jgi:hypothetical protein
VQRDGHAVEAMRDPGPVHARRGGRDRDAGRLRGRRGAGVDRHDGDRAQPVGGGRGQVLERVRADDERRVGVAAGQDRGRAPLPGARLGMAGGEAHRRRVAGLPREHVLGPGGVALVAEDRGDDVRARVEVADERAEGQGGDVVADVVEDRPVRAVAQPRPQVLQARDRRVARERLLADHRAQDAERLDVAVGRQRDEDVGLLRGGRALGVDDHERAALGRHAQALEEPRVGRGRVRPPQHHDLGAVADVAERRRARAAGGEGAAGGAVEERPRGVDRRAERVGEGDRGALRLDRRLAQAVDERRAGAGQDRGGGVECLVDAGLAAVDARDRDPGVGPGGEPCVAERARGLQAQATVRAGDGPDVVAQQAAGGTGHGHRLRRGHRPASGRGAWRRARRGRRARPRGRPRRR